MIHQEIPERDGKNTEKPPNPSLSSLISIFKRFWIVKVKLKKPKKNKQETDKSNQPELQSKGSNRLAVISVIINGILAVTTFLLWYQSVNQTKIAERASHFQQEFTKRDIRAYVGYEIDGFIFNIKDGMGANVKIFNAGKSPARFVYNTMGFFADTTEREIDSIFNLMSGAIRRRETFGYTLLTSTGDSKTATLSSKIVLSGGPISAKDSLFYYAAMMLDRFVILGQIKYYDVFNERHITTYCIISNPITGVSRPYWKYNDAD